MSTGQRKSVLFICLGNICRSPIAEAVLKHLVKEKGIEAQFEIDSAATAGYHVGEQPDSRAFKVLQQKGIKYQHTVRKIQQDDFTKFDYIFGMDNENISNLKKIAPSNYKGTIALLGSYDPQNELIIRDPYYDDNDKGFYKCYDQCKRSCEGFIEKIVNS